jgi:hypothetical protein
MSNASEVDRLREDLLSTDAVRRLASAEKLMRTPGLARALAPELLAICATENDALREVVMGAIEAMGPPKASRAREIACILASEETQSYWAATLLGRLGSEGGFAAGELATALRESPSTAVKERCAWALGQMGPAAKDALPVLEQAAASSSPRLARFAREAITAILGR